MMLIQNGTQGPTTPPTKQAAVGTPGYAYGGPPGSTAATRWDPDVANTIIAELAGLVTNAGLSIDPTNNNQLVTAVPKVVAHTANTFTVSQVFSAGLVNKGLLTLTAADGSASQAAIYSDIATTGANDIVFRVGASGSYVFPSINSSGVMNLPGVPANADSSTKVPTTSWVQGNTLAGSAQTVQDVLSGRSTGVTYTNTTGRPIWVLVSAYNGAGDCALYWYLNGASGEAVGVASSFPTGGCASIIVPAGSTYKFTIAPGAYITTWIELR